MSNYTCSFCSSLKQQTGKLFHIQWKRRREKINRHGLFLTSSTVAGCRCQRSEAVLTLLILQKLETPALMLTRDAEGVYINPINHIGALPPEHLYLMKYVFY